MRKKGEKHPNSKLTTSVVRSMRRMYWCNNMMQREIAAIFNTTQPTVSEVVNYKYWVHISDDFRPDEIVRRDP